MNFLLYKPKNTLYQNLGTIEYCSATYIIYSDTVTGEIFFRIQTDFSKFENVADSDVECASPPSKGIVEAKIKLNGEWERCHWNIDENKLQAFL